MHKTVKKFVFICTFFIFVGSSLGSSDSVRQGSINFDITSIYESDEEYFGANYFFYYKKPLYSYYEATARYYTYTNDFIVEIRTNDPLTINLAYLLNASDRIAQDAVQALQYDTREHIKRIIWTSDFTSKRNGNTYIFRRAGVVTYI